MANGLTRGQLFDGRYRLERALGTGGMAEVWLARDEELGRKVAIKVLHDHHLADDSFLERFRREASSAASLSHPNIVQIYDRGECDGFPYIAMEVVLGPDLKDLIVDKGALSLSRAVGYARQVLAALGAAHEKGIVHRDIKPQNILIGDDGRLRVTDFGIARSATSELTEAGSLVGTASYIAPEQAQGQEVGPATDLYSTGVVLYELVTGRLPFASESQSSLEVAMKHVQEPPPPPRLARPDVPSRLETAILRALEKEPLKRFHTASEFDEALAEVESALEAGDDEALDATAATAVLAPLPIEQVEQYEPQYVEEPYERRHPWPFILAAALLLVIAALAGVGYLASQGSEPPEAVADPSAQTVEVPRLVGLTEAEAKARLDERHLKAEVEEAFSDTYPEGQVSSQSPAPGESLKRGGTVVLTVSKGPEQVDVPDVVGLGFEAAAAALDEAGLKPRRFDVPSSKPEGEVVAQSPKGRAPKGSSVRLNVSKGRTDVVVPDVVGADWREAAASLEEVGLGANVHYVPSDAPKDSVVAQNPPAGATVQLGSKVRLNVSDGSRTAPTETTPESEAKDVPDVVGLGEKEARKALEDAGFNYETVDEPVEDPSQDGVVLSQDPSGEAEPGSTVTIVVGRLSEAESNAPPPEDDEGGAASTDFTGPEEPPAETNGETTSP